MSAAEIAERKIYEMQAALDDLTSIAQEPGARDALRKSNLEEIERRLRYLRFDLMVVDLRAVG
jgi:hypothetical protein